MTGSGAIVQFDDGTISGNTAGTYGGGVYADASATVKLDSATIASNGARATFPGPGGGGGVYVDPAASVAATASVFSFNPDGGFLASYGDCLGTLVFGGLRPPQHECGMHGPPATSSDCRRAERTP